jgi:hypothetical protein
MWATHRGLSKPCANRASCPSPALGTCGSERCQGVPVGLDLHVQEIADQDRLLAILAGTAQAQDSAKMIALGASSLAEVTYVALRAFIDGVCHECGSLAERLSKDPFLQVWQSGVAQTVATLAAGHRAIPSAATAARFWTQHALWPGERWSWIVTRIVTDGVRGD